MSEVVMIQISPEQLQEMLDKAAAKAVIVGARAQGDYWGIQDLARHYDVCSRTIHHWIKEGHLPPRAGRRWLRADILQWDADRRDSSLVTGRRRAKKGPTDGPEAA